jgi:hypothetical protein
MVKSILKIKSVDAVPMAINRMKEDGAYYKEDDRGFFIRLNNENGEKIFERTIYGVPGDDKFFENFSNL